jgi:hypothetical protein
MTAIDCTVYRMENRIYPAFTPDSQTHKYALLTGDSHPMGKFPTQNRGVLQFRPSLGQWDAVRVHEGKLANVKAGTLRINCPSKRCDTLLDAAAYLLSPHYRVYDKTWRAYARQAL